MVKAFKYGFFGFLGLMPAALVLSCTVSYSSTSSTSNVPHATPRRATATATARPLQTIQFPPANGSR